VPRPGCSPGRRRPVACWYLDADAANSAAEEISAAGAGTAIARCGETSPDRLQVGSAFDQIRTPSGASKSIYNNAGVNSSWSSSSP